MTILWVTLWATSWLTFGVGTVWLTITVRRFTWEGALLLRAILTLLLIAGVIFMMLAAQPTHY